MKSVLFMQVILIKRIVLSVIGLEIGNSFMFGNLRNEIQLPWMDGRDQSCFALEIVEHRMARTRVQ